MEMILDFAGSVMFLMSVWFSAKGRFRYLGLSGVCAGLIYIYLLSRHKLYFSLTVMIIVTTLFATMFVESMRSPEYDLSLIHI